MSRSYMVTGGGRGIGRALVERLLGEADSVVAIELDPAALAWTDGHPAGSRVLAAGTGGAMRDILHEDLLLRVTFVVSDPGDAGPCPVPVGGHEVFVYVRKGVLGVTVDEEAHELRTGDSLDANSAETIQYRALGRGRAIALWASVAELDGRRRRAAR